MQSRNRASILGFVEGKGFYGRARLADVPELFREGIRAAIRGDYLKGALLAGEIAAAAGRYSRRDPIECLKAIGLSEILADYSARSAVIALGIPPEACKWLSQQIRLLHRKGYDSFIVYIRRLRNTLPADKMAKTVTLVRMIETAQQKRRRPK